MLPAETILNGGPNTAQPNGYINHAPHHINSLTNSQSTSSTIRSALSYKMTGQKMFSEAGPRDHALRVVKGLSLEEQVLLMIIESLTHRLTIGDLSPSRSRLLENSSHTVQRHPLYQNYGWSQWSKRSFLQGRHTCKLL